MARKLGETLTDMRVGKRNPRVLVAEMARHLRSISNSLTYRWQTGLHLVEPTDDGQHRWRRKVGDELPEHDPKEWGAVCDYAVALKFAADELLKFAEEQQRAARRRLETYAKDVHTEHCCQRHGCKYGESETCPVETGAKPQSFACEACDGV